VSVLTGDAELTPAINNGKIQGSFAQAITSERCRLCNRDSDSTNRRTVWSADSLGLLQDND